MTISTLPDSVAALKRLDREELRQAHTRGRCPDPGDLNGIADGVILDPRWFEHLRLWRGKVFSAEGSESGHGINRLGVGPFEFQRYPFKVRRTRSAFSNRQIVLLDHDLSENPHWVRIYHDELVEMHPGLYLACSHLKKKGKFHYASYFAFDFGRH